LISALGFGQSELQTKSLRSDVLKLCGVFNPSRPKNGTGWLLVRYGYYRIYQQKFDGFFKPKKIQHLPASKGKWVNPNHLKSNQVSIDFGLHEKWISDNLCKSFTMKDCITKSGSVTITLNQKPAK